MSTTASTDTPSAITTSTAPQTQSSAADLPPVKPPLDPPPNDTPGTPAANQSQANPANTPTDAIPSTPDTNQPPPSDKPPQDHPDSAQTETSTVQGAIKSGILKDSTPGPVQEPVPHHYPIDGKPKPTWNKCYPHPVSGLEPYPAEQLVTPEQLPEYIRFITWVRHNPTNTKDPSAFLSQTCEGRDKFTQVEIGEMIRGCFSRQGVIFPNKTAKRAVKDMILRLMVTPLSRFPSYNPVTSIFADPNQLELFLLAGREFFGDIYHAMVATTDITPALDRIDPAKPLVNVYSKITDKAVADARIAQQIQAGNPPRREFFDVILPGHNSFEPTENWKGLKYKRYSLLLFLQYMNTVDPTAKLIAYPLVNMTPKPHLTVTSKSYDVKREHGFLSSYMHDVWMRPGGNPATGRLYVELSVPTAVFCSKMEDLGKNEASIPKDYPIDEISGRLSISKSPIQAAVLAKLGWLHGSHKGTALQLLADEIQRTTAFLNIPHVDIICNWEEIRLVPNEKIEWKEKAYAVHVLCAPGHYNEAMQGLISIYAPTKKRGFPLHTKYNFIPTLLETRCTADRSNPTIMSNAIAYRAHQWEKTGSLRTILLEDVVLDPFYVPPLVGTNLIGFIQSMLDPRCEDAQKVFVGLDPHPANPRTWVLTFLLARSETAACIAQRLGTIAEAFCGEPGWNWFHDHYRQSHKASFKFDRDDKRYFSVCDTYMQSLSNTPVLQANYVLPSDYVPPACMVQSLKFELPRAHRTRSNFSAVLPDTDGTAMEQQSTASTYKHGDLNGAAAASLVGGGDTMASSTGSESFAHSDGNSHTEADGDSEMDEYDEIQSNMEAKLAALQDAKSGDSSSDERSTTGGDKPPTPDNMEIMVDHTAQPPSVHRVTWMQDLDAAPVSTDKVNPDDYTHRMIGSEDWISEADQDVTPDTKEEFDRFEHYFTKWATPKNLDASSYRRYGRTLGYIYQWYKQSSDRYFEGPSSTWMDEFFERIIDNSTLKSVLYDWISERIFFGLTAYPEAWDQDLPPGHPPTAVMRVPPAPCTRKERAAAVQLIEDSWIGQFPDQIPQPPLVLDLFLWARITSPIWKRFDCVESFIEGGSAKIIRDMQNTLMYAQNCMQRGENPFDTPLDSSSHHSTWFETDDEAPPDQTDTTPPSSSVKEKPPDVQGGQNE